MICVVAISFLILNGRGENRSHNRWTTLGLLFQSNNWSHCVTTYLPIQSYRYTYLHTTRIPTTYLHTTSIPKTYLPTTYLPTTYLPTTYLPKSYLPTYNIPTNNIPTYLEVYVYPPTFNIPTYSEMANSHWSQKCMPTYVWMDSNHINPINFFLPNFRRLLLLCGSSKSKATWESTLIRWIDRREERISFFYLKRFWNISIDRRNSVWPKWEIFENSLCQGLF